MLTLPCDWILQRIYIYDKAVKYRHITYNNATFNVSGSEIALKSVHYKLHI